ncbi:Gfo/Idh/MocA family protein [Altererythrobacter sp. Root672]|uniref:Gfo/Idh/MocA family protein n=1 Tax=Altererythrobacter sp. Root672 TaxID=1736584 RepID=UPI0006F96058|nr:Gfo/Idh/MocA family oxidoreductase [Altererythrobacter sp. Root672]KRA82631.1 galactose 1-dehydrogenase [Altererythrobacter sp. Root672]
MEPIRLAIVGLGKIARDQHLPAIMKNGDFALVATASADGASVVGVPAFDNLEALLASEMGLDAVAICTPPQIRGKLAATALHHGVYVLLEKPPAVNLSEAEWLADLARSKGATVFAGWHSRFAAGVATARAWLANRQVLGATIVWREDVRTWHPGQDWIWRAGGFGVFDPGINALSIATHILPQPLDLTDAELEFPANRDAPIAARLSLQDAAGAGIAVDLDWRQTGPQTWDIRIDTDAGPLKLSEGGAKLSLPSELHQGKNGEYPALYARFSDLVRNGESEFDTDPLRLVADAFLRGRTIRTDPFFD